MPNGISGRELAARLRAQKPSLKVIFSTGYSSELAGPGEEFEEGLNLIPKPYLPDKLVESVRRSLNGASSPRPRW